MHNPLKAVVLLTRRFARHPNSEHEQGLVRVALELLIGVSVLCYAPFEKSSLSLLLTLAGFLSLSALLLAHIAWRPQPIMARRVIAIINDVGGVTYAMLFAGELGVPIYLFYLWITFGNGFRFGKMYLVISLVGSLVGLTVVLMFADYWQQHRALGTGLWVGMVLVGLYFSTLVARLTKALQREEAANQAKRSFISSVSHELRTPLNAIIGMANLLQSTALQREQADMVRSLDNASHLMLALIEDVLDFSKIEAGKLPIEEIDFDLYRLLNSTVDIFRWQASARGLDLSVQIDPAVPFALRGDPHHLRQVLVNLMSNAIKFTDRGRIALRIECGSDAGQFVLLRFEVEDTGIGIAAAVQHKVFDSFTQADDSTSRRYGGTGLGTTISRQLVELMGGQLGLRSVVGVGSTFWFELDLKKQPSLPLVIPAPYRALLIGFAVAQMADLGRVLDSIGIDWEAVDSSNTGLVALRSMSAGASHLAPGSDYNLILLAAASVCAAGTADDVRLLVLRQTVADLQDAAGAAALPVMLCDGAIAARQARHSLAEQAGLVNVLQLPLRAEHMIHALHAVRARAAELGAVAPQASAPATKPAGSGYRILVAEDNPTNRVVILKMLQRAGHVCSVARDGEQALDQFDRQEFDAVIVDMNMPEMNGLDATRALRVLTPDRHLPIIMLSADVTAETRAECLAAGIDRFLPKPIQITALLDALDQLIEQHGTAPFRGDQPNRHVGAPIMLQPLDNNVVLNYATLAELDVLGQDHRFVDGLVLGFIDDNRQLLTRLEQALLTQQFIEFKDLLHAVKGSAMGIGALALRTTCALLEELTEAELQRDAEASLAMLRQAFADVVAALEAYQRQRLQVLA